MHLPLRGLVPLFTLGCLVAQAPELPSAPAAAVGVAVGADGTLVGIGPDYTMHFAEQAVAFVPVLGDVAPRTLTLQLQATHCGRVGDALAPVGAAARRHDERAVVYERAPFAERYTLRADGVKQDFVFAALPPGSGDLVVRLAVAGAGEPVRDEASGGLFFGERASGGVRIGAVLGRDAAGRTAAGQLQWRDGALECALPASFVDGAALPLVLDPLLTTVTAGTSAQPVDAVAIAFLAANTNQWFAVWRRTNSAVDHDLFGQKITAAGALSGAPIALESTAIDAGVPKVTEFGTFGWLVVWEHNQEVRAVYVQPTIVAASFFVSSGTDVHTTPDVVGVVTNNSALCVWRNATTDTIEGATIAFATTPTLGPVTTFASGGVFSTVEEPRLSRGTTAPLLTWTVQSSVLGTSSVRGQLLSLAGATVGSSFAIAGGTTSAFGASSAGDGLDYVVAYVTSSTFGDGIACVSVRRSGAAVELGTPQPLVTLATGLGVPDVALQDGSALVAWTHPGVSGKDVVAASVDPFTCTPVEALAVVDFAGNGAPVALASQYRRDLPSSDQIGITWVDVSSGINIRFRAWQAVDGLQTTFGGGCSHSGRVGMTGGVVGNANFGVQLYGATPGELAFAVVSGSVLLPGFTCGPCTVYPDFTVGVIDFVGTTSAAGTARYALPIPNTPGLAGVVLLAQYVRFGTDCLGSFALTPAVSVQIQ